MGMMMRRHRAAKKSEPEKVEAKPAKAEEPKAEVKKRGPINKKQA